MDAKGGEVEALSRVGLALLLPLELFLLRLREGGRERGRAGGREGGGKKGVWREGGRKCGGRREDDRKGRKVARGLVTISYHNQYPLA